MSADPKASEPAESAPLISVIVSTYQRLEQLRACLSALVRLDYPRNRFEVLVIDDGGLVPLDSVVEEFRDRIRLQLIRQPNSGPARARNTGAAYAKGTLLAFTDDDCEPATGWLRVLARQHVVAPGQMIGGRTLNRLQDNPYSTASEELVAYLYSYYNTGSSGARFFTSNNMAVPASLFRSVGGFDTEFPLAAGEDRELCDRWRGLGHGMVYLAEAIIYHGHRMTLRGFLRQHFNYGRGAFYYHRARARRRDGHIRVEPPSFYLNLLRQAALRTRSPRPWLNVLLIGVSQVANAAGFFWELLRRRQRRAPAVSAEP